LSGAHASGQIVFDFETGGDQGWGNPFSADPANTVMLTVENVGGSNRLRAIRDGSFQEVARRSHSQVDPFHLAMAAAAVNDGLATISYDWYVDTSPGTYGSFLQLGTYYNTDNGFYDQDFPNAGKDVELDGAQLASGQVFSGTVAETLSVKGVDLPIGDTGYELGFIVNGDGPAGGQRVYFDNVRISIIPEPASLALAGLAATAIAMMRRRSAVR
jgi:hypothetical protein